ncbi:UDP-glucose 4-epimerase [Cystobacter fuscus]|uniref:UDP-glucose 4-epimerase n=1 Tax=Cystobacter fuscus TaxID=43 RepID=A0A250J913_9BACT|nr:hypothetical protein [Cystobacter fuscus]ATB40040.1 UDP-glucose 4-epimerase [Cystobacter fuscus]
MRPVSSPPPVGHAGHPFPTGVAPHAIPLEQGLARLVAWYRGHEG